MVITTSPKRTEENPMVVDAKVLDFNELVKKQKENKQEKKYVYDMEEVTRVNKQKRDREIARRRSDNSSVVNSYGLLRKPSGGSTGGSGSPPATPSK